MLTIEISTQCSLLTFYDDTHSPAARAIGCDLKSGASSKKVLQCTESVIAAIFLVLPAAWKLPLADTSVSAGGAAVVGRIKRYLLDLTSGEFFLNIGRGSPVHC